jgi:hypothetical protein
MNKLLTFIALMLFSVLSFAQPINNDCAGIIDLGEAPICPSPAIYTKLEMITSQIVLMVLQLETFGFNSQPLLALKIM